MNKSLTVLAFCALLATNAQAQWTNQNSAFTTASRGIIDVDVVTADIVWAVAYDGALPTNPIREFTRTLNGGTTWTPGTITAAATLAISTISAIDGMTAWACLYPASPGADGGIFKTIDGGVNWTKQTTATFSGAAAFPDFVYFFSATNGFAVGDPNGGFFEIYTTTDGGTTWVRTPTGNIPAPMGGEYAFVNDFDVEGNTFWFGTNMGRIYKSVDGGLNWTVATVQPMTYTVSDVVFRNTMDGLAETFSGTTRVLRRTLDGGATWSTVTPTGTFFTGDLENIPGTAIYVSTGASGAPNNGSSFSVDDGATWLTIEATDQRLTQGWFSATVGWCGGFNLDAFTDGMFKYNGGTVGVQALNREDARMRVFPNPSNGTFTVQIAGAEKNDAAVKIMDVVGNVVYTRIIENNTSVIEKSVDLSSIPKGIYFVAVQNGSTFFTDKLIVE